MPPSNNGVDSSIALFKSIGLSQSKAAEAAKSPKSAGVLRDIIDRHGLTHRDGGISEKQGGLIAALAIQIAKSAAFGQDEQDYVIRKILTDKLKSVEQVKAATKYLESHSSPIDEGEFDEHCGVGFTITPEELYTHATDYIVSNAIAGWGYLSTVINGMKGTPNLRWANPLELKNAVEKAFTEKFGPRTVAKPKEQKKDANTTTPKRAESDQPSHSSSLKKTVFEEGFLGQLHKPGENPQLYPRLREAHLAATGGIVRTRFPPEPNGYLHIGHAKAIFINFGYAAHHGGECYLRFDDTNPEAEEACYFESIVDTVRWLGYQPRKITYSSDYFDQLYDLAVDLIKRDKAYVCHCTQEEIKTDRGQKSGGRPKACVHRSRPVSESLVEFENMKGGKYRPKEANLRMKQDLEDGNPQMWDLTAYRIIESHHHRTHDKWRIYPTYDFTHCLVDSFENISHSLCTVEFIASRQSYEWLCDMLEVYKPKQSEYGRLSMEGTVLSKRKILTLVNEGIVRGWDDPRLYTLIALRRRGVPPGAILSFVGGLGVSTAASNIEIPRFNQTIRQHLEGTVPRLHMILYPIKVTIKNLPEDYIHKVEKPLHPKVPELGNIVVPFTRTIYIEADDFRLSDSKNYFRLAPGKTVGLFQAPYPITCTSYTIDASSGQVIELVCRLENGPGPAQKPKAFIQWIAEHPPSRSPVRVDETRLFSRLFKTERVSHDFKADLSPDSLKIVKGAMLEVGFWSVAKRCMVEAGRESKLKASKGDPTCAIPEQPVGMECVRFQGLRVAYFAVDKDSRLSCLDEGDDVDPGRRPDDFLALNRIVDVKEDSGK